MRKDGLTTAKMLAIVTLMSFNRRIKLPYGEDDKKRKLERNSERLKEIVKAGISLAEFIEQAKKFDFQEVEAVMKKSNALEFWNEEHEHYFPDISLENDGTSSPNEENAETGFIGLKQIEAEKREKEFRGEVGKQAAE
jgi:hypothetical protein